MTKRLPIAAVLLFLVSACGGGAKKQEVPKPAQRPASEPAIDLGKVENGVYSNGYFGMTIPVPKDWHVASNETMEHLKKVGEKAIAGDDKALQAALESVPTLNLISLFEKPPGTPMDFNPSYICIAERVMHLPGIQEGSDYLLHAKKLLAANMSYKIKPEFRTVQVDGRSMDVMDVELSVANQTVKQQYCTMIEKGYAVSMIISFINDTQKEQLDKILASTSFKSR